MKLMRWEVCKEMPRGLFVIYDENIVRNCTCRVGNPSLVVGKYAKQCTCLERHQLLDLYSGRLGRCRSSRNARWPAGRRASLPQYLARPKDREGKKKKKKRKKNKKKKKKKKQKQNKTNNKKKKTKKKNKKHKEKKQFSEIKLNLFTTSIW